jgi:quercetin dioxygenase-like cupin family protein
MSICRLFTGPDGRTHFEDQSLASHPALRSERPATGFYVREFPAGTFLDWHPAPRRQLVVLLAGRLEHEVGDGRVRQFGPGDARLMEDTTGRGHTTRVLGDAPALVAVVPLVPLVPSA